MRLFKFRTSRLSDTELDEIRDQVRTIHEEMVRRRKDDGEVHDLHAYFVEQDYWPLDGQAGDDGSPQLEGR